ncbi:hypothetical protein BJQ89_03150 [Arthrobacter sp. ES1]|nr:hypothetical protein [Arthrobacter sp. ES1]
MTRFGISQAKIWGAALFESGLSALAVLSQDVGYS